MDAIIKHTKKLKGQIQAPGSKSYTHRILAAASLGSNTMIKNPSHSEANTSMKSACEKFGAIISGDIDWNVKGFNGQPHNAQIFIGNSGTALRLSIALATLVKNGKTKIDGDNSLRQRPNDHLIVALEKLGAHINPTHPDGKAPVEITGTGLQGGKTSVSGTLSSQYLSSLLLVSPFAKEDVEIEVEGNLVSQPYINMTLEILNKFGITVEDHNCKRYVIKADQEYVSPSVYQVPGDYSQAAFPLAAACLTDSEITVTGLNKNDNQGDKEIIKFLKQMGADIDDSASSFVKIHGASKLQAIEADLKKTPDLFPVLAVLGIFAEGDTKLFNMPQIRSKETDRIAVIEREFKKMGVDVMVEDDALTIRGKNLPQDANFTLSSHGDNHGITDHRIAMALSLIGLCVDSVTIKNADRIDISYPSYIQDMKSLGVKIFSDAPYLAV